MKKVLIATTVSGFVPQFEMNNVKILQSMNYEIHYATNYLNPVYRYDEDIFEKYGIIKHQVDFVRSPFSLQNIKIYKQLKDIITKERYDLIHCHTPMGGVLTRIAARKLYKQGTKIVYTAHGFHFFKGAPKLNWMLYYPMERFLSRWTNVIVTMNEEDYSAASKFMQHKIGVAKKINGVGIQIDKPNQKSDFNLREVYHLSKNDFIIMSVGELIKRKNHEVVIRALEQLRDKNMKYFICGSGVLMQQLQKYIDERKLSEQVFLLGYRTDVSDLLSQADCFIHPSLQEGLSVAIMEAMRSGVPIICSDIRGNRDLVSDGIEALLVRDNQAQQYAMKIRELKNDKSLCKNLSLAAQKKLLEFDLVTVENQMKLIYQSIEG